MPTTRQACEEVRGGNLDTEAVDAMSPYDHQPPRHRYAAGSRSRCIAGATDPLSLTILSQISFHHTAINASSKHRNLPPKGRVLRYPTASCTD